MENKIYLFDNLKELDIPKVSDKILQDINCITIEEFKKSEKIVLGSLNDT